MKKFVLSKQKPSQKLQDIIDTYWRVANVSSEDIHFPIVPDGCVDIVLVEDEIFLVGLMEFASIKCIKPNEHYLGIRFKPATIASLLDRDISLFNDKLIPLKTLDSLLHDRLQKLDKEGDVYGQLDSIFEEVFVNVRFDNRILFATQKIVSSGGEVDFDVLCLETALSQKTVIPPFCKASWCDS